MMERLVLTFLLGVSLSAAVDTVSFVRRIFPGDSVRFALPEGETCILAMKSAEDPSFSYKYYFEGKKMISNVCDKCFSGSLWVPYLMITEKRIRHVHSGSIVFPENLGSSQARHLSIESKGSEAVELQVFTLPLKGHELVAMPRGGSVNLSLPEKEGVWLALWNDQETTVLVAFNLYYETEPAHETFQANVEKGWFIILIYSYKIVYGGNLHNLKKHGLKGRRLEWYNPSSLKYQLFSMPLDPKVTEANEEASSNIGLTIVLPVVVSLVLLLLLLLGASYLGYRFGRKRNTTGSSEGPAQMELAARPVARGGVTRPHLTEETENPIYGLPRLQRPWR
ncbi:uncharacterized protein [Macrobrachium rosenbergii]|uniref:uncharacterized protein n=1 Tax=Macrobrachium rosenbergii TaxID=79674 RepID=UPI0034D6FAA6